MKNKKQEIKNSILSRRTKGVYMKKILLTVLILGVMCSVLPLNSAHAAYDEYNGYYYTKVKGTSGTQAQATAQAIGSQWNLVSIKDLAENNWLMTTFAPGPASNKLWIGFSDTGSGWNWVDGAPTTFTNWDSSYPDNGPLTSYAAMNGTGNWESSPNNFFTPAMGIAKAVAPEPLSAILFVLGGAGLVAYRRKKRK